MRPALSRQSLDSVRQETDIVQTPALQAHPRRIGFKNKILHCYLQFGRMVACGES